MPQIAQPPQVQPLAVAQILGRAEREGEPVPGGARAVQELGHRLGQEEQLAGVGQEIMDERIQAHAEAMRQEQERLLQQIQDIERAVQEQPPIMPQVMQVVEERLQQSELQRQEELQRAEYVRQQMGRVVAEGLPRIVSRIEDLEEQLEFMTVQTERGPMRVPVPEGKKPAVDPARSEAAKKGWEKRKAKKAEGEEAGTGGTGPRMARRASEGASPGEASFEDWLAQTSYHPPGYKKP